MLEGFVPWPAEAAANYRRLGLWEDLTVAEMVERAMRQAPDKDALVFNDRRINCFSYRWFGFYFNCINQ